MRRFAHFAVGVVFILLACLVGRAQRPEIVPQIGHANFVYCTAFRYDNQIFASGDQAGTLKLWETQSGRLLRTIVAHYGAVTELAFNSDGEVLVSVSKPRGFSHVEGNAEGLTDGTAKLWNVRTGNLLVEVDFAARPLAHFAFSPDGTLFAAGNDHNTIKIWEAHTGRLLRTLVGHTRPVGAITFNSDGTRLGSGNKFGLDEDDFGRPCETIVPLDHARLWDVKTGRVLTQLRGCASVSFSSNGTLAADDVGNVYEASTGAFVRSLGGRFVAFTRDHDIAVISTKENAMNGVDVQTGNVLYTFAGSDQSQGDETENVISPDGAILIIKVIFGSKFAAWDLLNGNLLYLRQGLMFEGFNPAGNYFVTSRTIEKNKEILELNDNRSGESFARMADDDDFVGFSMDGQFVVTGFQDSLRVRSTRSGEILQSTKSSEQLSVIKPLFSSDKRTLAVSRSGRYEFWDTRSGSLTRTFPVENSTVDFGEYQTFGFSPDGQLFATGDGQVWKTQSGELVNTVSPGHVMLGSGVNAVGTDSGVELRDTETNRVLNKINAPADAKFTLSPDNRLLAVSMKDSSFGRYDETRDVASLYDVATGKPLRRLRATSGFVVRMIFSPNSKMLVVTLGVGNGGWVNNFLFDVGTGRRLTDFTEGLKENERGVGDAVLAFSPDSKMVVMAGGTGNEYREVPSGKSMKRKSTSTSSGQSADYSPDGTILATGDDVSIKFWSVASGELLATALSFEHGDWLVVTPDGLFDGSPNGWHQMLWRFGGDTFNVASAEVYFNEFYYPGLLSDIFAGQRPKATKDILQRDRRQPQLKLSLADVEPNTTITARNVKIRIGVSQAQAGANDLRLFRNGSLVKVWRGDVLKGQDTVSFEATIPIVAGENKMTAYAFNRDNIKSSDAEIVITGADSLKRAGTLYVLAIGVGQYANPEFNLNYTSADAKDFGDEMRRQQELLQGENAGRYKQVKVIPLLNQDATKANILLGLSILSGTGPDKVPEGTPAELAQLQPSQPEDGVFLYFSGHGTAQKDRFYLIPHDIGYLGSRKNVNAEGLQTILSHSISDVELEEAFRGIDAGELLLVIDACNSGQALQAEDSRRGPMNTKGLAQLAYEKGMYVLTASQSIELAFESEALKHSYMTYALIEEGLKTRVTEADGNHDGKIWLREWFDYAVERVPHMRDNKIAQTAKQQNKSLDIVEVEEKGKVQTPRVFYRREPDTHPWVVAQIK